MTVSALDDELEAAWELGVFPGDAERLVIMAELNAGSPRAAELNAFATAAALMARRPMPRPIRPEPGAAPAIRVLAKVIEAWRAAFGFDLAQASAALAEAEDLYAS